MHKIVLQYNGKEYFYNGWFMSSEDGKRYPNYVENEKDALMFVEKAYAINMVKSVQKTVTIEYDKVYIPNISKCIEYR